MRWSDDRSLRKWRIPMNGLGIVTDGVFSALIIVVIGTTLVTPPALKWSQSRMARRDTAGPSR